MKEDNDLKLYTIPDNSQALTEEDVMTIVNNSLTNFKNTTRILKGYIQTGSGTNSGGINVASQSSDIILWAGQDQSNTATAPFRVDAAGNLTATSATISGYVISSKGAFGGDGSDGALSISSGTTTVDLGSASVVIKNYTSISITGTGKLSFSNPHAQGTIIILKSKGAVTLTSSTTPCIDASGLGADGGAGGAAGVDGTVGTKGNSNVIISTNGGGGGIFGNTTPNAGGVALGAINITGDMLLACGGGGGGGSGAAAATNSSAGSGGSSATSNGTLGTGSNTSSGITGGTGGKGGGALYIECGGAYNATGTLSAAGNVGGTANSNGGGGGGGGALVVRYASLTANTATYTVSGGAGYAGTNGTGGIGGAGYSSVAINNTKA